MPRTKAAIICLCVLLIGGLNLAAQEARLGGPVSGFIFDSAMRSIRPILGLPGASYLGEALVADLDWASIAPSGEVALAAKEGRLYALRGLGAEQAWAEIEGALGVADRAAWSADGAAAVISSQGRLQVLRNLREEPLAGAAVELPGRVSALALEASGGCAVAGVKSAAQGGLYLACPDAPVRLLAAMGEPAAVVLARGGRHLLAAERAGSRLLEIQNFREAATVMPFAEMPGTSWDPVGLAIGSDHRLLFVAHRSEKRVDTFDLETRTLVGQMGVDWEPMLAEPLAVKSVFLLKSTGGEGEPLLVLDAGRESAVYFVPAGRAE